MRMSQNLDILGQIMPIAEVNVHTHDVDSKLSHV